MALSAALMFGFPAEQPERAMSPRLPKKRAKSADCRVVMVISRGSVRFALRV
jgi:hypothetical protein